MRDGAGGRIWGAVVGATGAVGPTGAAAPAAVPAARGCRTDAARVAEVRPEEGADAGDQADGAVVWKCAKPS